MADQHPGGYDPAPPSDLDLTETTGSVEMFAYNELGKTGLKHYSGVLYEEYLPQLQGRRANAVYTEMAENDPVIGGSLFAIESLLRSVPWAVEPASSEQTAVELATFVEECMDDMSHTWEDFISEVLTMIRFGWSFFEITWKQRLGDDDPRPGAPQSKYSDGLVGWRKFSPRSQDTLYRWRITRNGSIKGMWQIPPPTGVEDDMDGEDTGPSDFGFNTIFIPMEKALLFRTTSHKNSPQGRSLLRTAYRPWYFCKRIEEIEAIGLERDMAGLPIGWVPLELLQSNRSAAATEAFRYWKDIITRTKRDEQEGMLLPLVYDENGNKLYDFELASTGGRRTFDTGAIVQRYNQQKAMSMLADFILLGHEAVGSFALSSDKTELFAVALGSILDNIEDVLNRHAIPRLMKLNGLPTDARMPQFRHGDIEKPDLAALIQFVQGLANAGAPIFPDLVLENHLRGVADLPPISEEEREQIMSEQAAMAAQQMGGMGGGLGIGGGGGPGAGGPGGGGKGNMVGFPGSGESGGQRPPPRPNTGSSGGGPGRPGELNTLQKAVADLVRERIPG